MLHVYKLKYKWDAKMIEQEGVFSLVFSKRYGPQALWLRLDTTLEGQQVSERRHMWIGCGFGWFSCEDVGWLINMDVIWDVVG